MTDISEEKRARSHDIDATDCATDTRKHWIAPVITELVCADDVEGGAALARVELASGPYGTSYRPS